MMSIRNAVINYLKDKAQECEEAQRTCIEELATLHPESFAANRAELGIVIYGVKAEILLAFLEVLGVKGHG